MNQKKKFSYYNISTWPDHKINYWGIPKCANTAIKYAFISTTLDSGDDITALLDESDYGEWIHHIGKAKYLTPKEAMSNGYTNVTIVRHPYDRVMSLYRDFVLRRPKSHNKGSRTLDDFIYKVIAPSDDTINTNLHYRSISSFVSDFDKTRLLVDDVFDLSDIDSFFGKYNIPRVKLNKNSINTEECLSTLHKKVVFQRYKDDFRLFGYTIL